MTQTGSNVDERRGNRRRARDAPRPKTRMPGESTIQPPRGSSGIGCSVVSVVVCRPVASAADTSPTRAAASGATALMIVLLPIPDCPTSTACSPCRRASSGPGSRFADSGCNGVAQPAPRREPLEEGVEARQVGLVRDQQERAALGLRGNRPPVDELEVGRQVRRDDADQQRDVRRDQLLLEGVGAIDEVAARLDRLDRAAAPCAGHPDAVAARRRGVPPLQQAHERRPIVQADREMPPPGGDDRARVPSRGGASSMDSPSRCALRGGFALGAALRAHGRARSINAARLRRARRRSGRSR